MSKIGTNEEYKQIYSQLKINVRFFVEYVLLNAGDHLNCSAIQWFVEKFPEIKDHSFLLVCMFTTLKCHASDNNL